MAIRPVKELPVRRGGFAANGSFVDACKRYIKAHPDKLRGVHAGMRGGTAYVWREVER